MVSQDVGRAIDTLLSQCLARRLPQSKWLQLLHQLLRRLDESLAANGASSSTSNAPTAAHIDAAGLAVKTLLSRTLDQPLIDPLLIEYLQGALYGSANRSGIEPDQGPITDVITATLYFLTLVYQQDFHDQNALLTLIQSLESVSSVLGQGLVATFSAPTAYIVTNDAFLELLTQVFQRAAQPRDSTASQPDKDTSVLCRASMAFVVANLRLVTLASHPSIASPQNLLCPRVGVTLLMNMAQGLLGHVYQTMLTLSQRATAATETASTQDSAHDVTAQIDSILETMNPAWKSEISLLRNLNGQIDLIVKLCRSLSSKDTLDASSGAAHKRAAEAALLAQKRAVWDHFIDVDAIASPETGPATASLSGVTPSTSKAPASAPTIEPEVALLLHQLVDQQAEWAEKLNSVKSLLLSRRLHSNPSVTLEKSLTAFYFEMLHAAVEACASVIETPPAFKGAETYPALWRNVVCGLLPEVILQIEQWLDATPDLPVRGQRQEAPHVRVESALKATLLIMADRLTICETAGQGPSAAADTMNEMMPDVVGMDTPPNQPIKAWMLRAFIEHSLARPEAITDEFPAGHKLASEVQSLPQSLQMDAQLEGLTLAALFESRFSSGEDPVELLHRVASDPGTLFTFSQQLTLQLQSWLDVHDFDSISRWCKALPEDLASLDTIMVYIDPVQMVHPLASLLDRQDLDQASDEPSTLGSILLFLQLLCHRYNVGPDRIVSANNGAPCFFAEYLSTASACHTLSDLSEDDRALVGRWIHALFGNEGISDDLIQASSPKTLLKLSPLLFSQSITACIYGVIDLETLRGGLSYFLQDLLSYALPGALNWLLREVLRVPLIPILDLLSSAGLQGNLDVPSNDGTLGNGLPRKANSRTVYLDVLALLLDSDSCPSVVRQLVARSFDRFVTSSRLHVTLEGCDSLTLSSVRARMESAGCTVSIISAEYPWLRSLLTQSQIPMSDSPQEQVLLRSLSQQLEVSSARDVFRQMTSHLTSALTSTGDSRSVEKALAARCALGPCAPETPLLKLVSQLDLAEAKSEASAAPMTRFLVLIFGLLHASDVLFDSAKASQAAETASAGLFDDEEDTHKTPSHHRYRIRTDQVVSILGIRLVRLATANPSLYQAYVNAVKSQQDCIAPGVRNRLWRFLGLPASADASTNMDVDGSSN
ncbi:Med5-domain-containing protein [Testicularia cyperi]|uniref:Mediator of RNA polymerase II transcription subunit 5 n=1 Tax=Testicularia cyperi TaxID=1882483 RepID=A0A317XNT7_9BASI|nr:Med5-domain-containing protein [Testicularia cyperi]